LPGPLQPTLRISFPTRRSSDLASVFSDNMEAGNAGWITGGVRDNWALVASKSHSASHSWTDSPAGNYRDNTDSYLESPLFDLTRSEEHTSELQSRENLVCRLLL